MRKLFSINRKRSLVFTVGRRRGIAIVVAALVSALVAARSRADDLTAQLPRIAPTEPRAALATFETLPGFRMELIAAEPLVVDPVAMVYDANGRAYVAEMRDYPHTDAETDIPFQDSTSEEPLGRIRLLLDTDDDGRFDESHVFADELSWPTGIACFKDGIYVAATPDIWYLEDTDGDHRADLRTKVFTGFRKFNVQAVMNNLVWGLDHRIYGAASGNGGKITRPGAPRDEPIVVTRRDFRFHPGSHRFEAISGGARFGNTFDDWGNRFICNIRNPVQHVVLPYRYLARNPYLPVPSALHDAAATGDQLPVYRISPPEPWRVVRAKRWATSSEREYPRSETAAVGYFTSSSGITIYRGSAYPREFYGHAFIGEVATNAVHRQRIEPQGVTFRATRADENREFLASTDNWFRPVNFVNAPDGTLHILDMYRETIEHPWSIPDDIKRHLDLRSGDDRGRIYRLAYGDERARAVPRLGEATTAELVRYLEHADSWWRDTAHRLIYERQDTAAVAPLRRMLDESSSAVARLHALWSLEGLQALGESELIAALADRDPHVREHAVRLAESRMVNTEKLAAAVIALARDADLRVRCQVAFTLGELNDDDSLDALTEIAQRDVADPWVRTAVLSSSARGTIELIERLSAAPQFVRQKHGPEFLNRLAFVIGARYDRTEVRDTLTQLTLPSTPIVCRREILLGLGTGLRAGGEKLASIAPSSPREVQVAVSELLDEARRIASRSDRLLADRLSAIGRLSLDRFDSASPVLQDLVDSREPNEIQLAAVDAMTRFADPAVATRLLEGWSSLSPSVRDRVLARLVTRNAWITELIEALETERLAAGQITPSLRQTLLTHRNPTTRARAEAVFAIDPAGPRKEVIARYSSSPEQPPDQSRGLAVFRQHCKTCHQLAGEGQQVGPALETVRHRAAEELLVQILDPNREVTPNHLEYSILMTDGRILGGVIAAETANSITLRQAEGASETILRASIDEIHSTGKSIMPEGLEKSISPRAMADLIALIRGEK